MSNHPAPTPNSPATSPTHELYDEHSGVYGFFRRHQKKLLYSAGLFTLLTFSITGSMISGVGALFDPRKPRGTVEVHGKTVQLLDEDYEVAGRLENALSARPVPVVPMTVLPPLADTRFGASEMSSAFAILRRVAIAEGHEVSRIEVDRAIDSFREALNAPSRERLALMLGQPSLASYRELMAEAMRIGNYVKLQTLGLDTSDAQVLNWAVADQEKITLRVATFDQKKLEQDLAKASTLGEAELRAWFDAKSDNEKQAMQAYDLPQAKLHFGALLLAEFSPEQWQADLLKDLAITEDQLRNYYEQEKNERYKIEGKEEWKPFEDETVKQELTRLVQAEHVMNQLLGRVREKQVEALKAPSEELQRTQTEAATQQTVVSELGAAVATKEVEIGPKDKQLILTPDDAALKAEVETMRAAVQKLRDDLATAEAALANKKLQVGAAEEALRVARAKFDFPGVFAELTKDKQGFVVKSTTELRNGEQLVDLDACGVGLGNWPMAARSIAFQSAGELGSFVGRARKGVFLLQAAELDSKPLKAWDKLQPLVSGAYFAETAKKQADEKKKVMEDALLRLGKEKLKDKVAELEGKRPERVAEKYDAWLKKLEADLASAQAMLATPDLGALPRAEYQRKFDTCKAQLDTKDKRREAFEKEVEKLVEREIADEVRKVYGEVLAGAAEEAGFTVTELPAYPRKLSSRPRFTKAFDPTVVYLFQSQSRLKQGEATPLLFDAANSRYHVAVCTKVEPLQVGDLTWREFESLRLGGGGASFEVDQVAKAYVQAFAIAALEQRYRWKPLGGEQRVVGTETDPKGK
ncbi:MAG: hypothetical protein JNL12_07210 [Planctomycetes bacterium]|nr:hypothetical protein [Planctomycetota bacterium]